MVKRSQGEQVGGHGLGRIGYEDGGRNQQECVRERGMSRALSVPVNSRISPPS